MPEVKKETSPARPEGSKPPVPSPTPDSFSLAHLSDLHLTSLKGTAIGQLLNKRMLGYLSWWRKRRRVHRLDIVEALLEDLKTTRPDHIAVTGDLTHLGLPDEFTDAGQWLARFGSPDQVTVIPGNHEAYVGQQWSAQLSAWAPYLISDDRQDSASTGELFPSLRIRGKVALIGLCSARPSLPFLAVGSLGEKQLGILAGLLLETGKAGLLRVVLIHHPPVNGVVSWRKRLTDAEAFRAIVQQHGAELILHGHAHRRAQTQIQTPGGYAPVIGISSASATNRQSKRRAQYHIYRLSRTAQGWQVHVCVRSFVRRKKYITQDEFRLL